ncbi:MAG: ATP-binding protein, partial [Deltaproteobacteria bacterium]|nr:ATP-binding protein [Deltaproteobacteria bacterium]
VGVLANLARVLGVGKNFPLEAFLVFLALLGLTLLFLSGQIRQQMKELISRQFGRPLYDYRREWREFTHRTTSLVDVPNLCNAVAKMVAETFGISSVSIWLLDESKANLMLSAATFSPKVEAKFLKLPEKNAAATILALRQQKMPIDFNKEDNWVGEFKRANPEFFAEGRILYGFPLAIKEDFLGFMTVNERARGKKFSVEDFDFLRTIADQTASSLLNLKLSERLRQVKEIEALQTMSAFMIHDLKNVASTFSLTMQNLPVHFDNPEFRQDAIRLTQQSVSKINNICAGLSSLSQKLELKKIETDLNEMLGPPFSKVNGGLKGSVKQDLQPIPHVFIDPEQIQKVLTNLLLNANEATLGEGEIRVSTGQKDGWVCLAVSDNGCGMTKDFIEKSLFRPFKTTKMQGMGIGLFQSKMIVEAHHGRIEVESEEGRGSTFRILLPVKEKGENKRV